MRFRCFAVGLCAAGLLLAGGCAQEQPDGQSTSQATVQDNTWIQTADDGTELVRATVRQVEVADLADGQAGQVIQDYYDAVYAEEQAQWETEWAEQAQDEYDQAKENGRAFRPYTVEEDFAVVRNDEAYLSIQRSSVRYTGGAQEEQIISCENFRKADGSLLTLDSVFRPDTDYTSILLVRLQEELAQRIQNGADYYFADAAGQLSWALEQQSFSLTDDHLTFVYPCYLLAPYAAGVQFFEIPLSELSEWLAL